MFFNLVRKNSKQNRKENSLFFASLILSIIAFYVILSLQKQDVMIFLKKMESDAVDHLFSLIPSLYVASLFILFFLVYFAEKYQFARRSHELGLYLMLGMRRGKLFAMLLVEEIWNSIVSLIVGIPVAVFLSEMISLVIAKIVGLGIIGHTFTFSMEAVWGTIAGYLVIRLVALAILSGKIAKKEIDQMLSDKQEEKQKNINRNIAKLKFVFGMMIVLCAVSFSINGYSWKNVLTMGLTLVLGMMGVFLLFQGISVLFEQKLKRNKNKKQLGIFTFRQLEENVFLQSNSLAISSILILAAICCFGFGISMAINYANSEQHTMDYTFPGEEKEIIKELDRRNVSEYFQDVFEVKVGFLTADEDTEHSFDKKSLEEAVKKQKDSEEKDIMMNYIVSDNNHISSFECPYLISLSGYNRILESQGKTPLKLKENEIALYGDPEFTSVEKIKFMTEVLKEKPFLLMHGEKYEFISQYCQENIVTDRAISIWMALIVPDHTFEELSDKNNTECYCNAILKKDFVKKYGLMQAISMVNEKLEGTDYPYESYLQNMGRKLFWQVAVSYITIYLAVIFLIIANTVMGVQFLMQQKKVGKRYQTLMSLGGQYTMICDSARKQIRWYFGMPVVIAAILSVFGVRSMYTGLLSSTEKGNMIPMLIAAVAIILLLCVVEFIYMIVVMKMSDRNLLEVLDIRRNND